MSGRKQSRGDCAFCGRNFAKYGLIIHLRYCPQRREAIEQAAKKRRKGQEQLFYHLLVQDARQPHFWLHLEMNSRASLEELDYYLRAIWLDCCGHPSRFFVRDRPEDEIPEFWRLDRVLEPGLVLSHLYDFETPSETLVRRVGTRTGQPLRALPVGLLARNRLPETTCVVCGQPAEWYCAGCLAEDGRFTTLCAAHAAEHRHDRAGEPRRLFNSPRVGLCGYDGPAEPPY